MCFFVRVNEMARNHRALNFVVVKAERHDFGVSCLLFEDRKIDCVPQNARRRSCFESACCESQFLKALGESKSAAFSESSARRVVFADENASAQECACGEDNRTARNDATAFGDDSDDFEDERYSPGIVPFSALLSLSGGRGVSLFVARIFTAVSISVERFGVFSSV